MKNKRVIDPTKLRGGYYTPADVADFVVNQSLKNFDPHSILEPGCGDGSFLKSLIRNTNKNKKFNCIGIELSEIEANKARKIVDSRFEIISSDFFNIYQNYKEKKINFDLILGNPPFIRYQYLTREQRIAQSQLLIDNGMKPNKLINAWVAFLVASIDLMKPYSRIGFIVPTELLQVTYAKDLRSYLLNNLSKIKILAINNLLFENVQQETLLFLGEKNLNNVKCEIEIINTYNINAIKNNHSNYVDIYYEDDNDKWTKYFLNEKELKLYRYIKEDDRFIKFTNYANVDVGITTGANKYFTINKNTVNEYELNNVVIPLIGRSSHTRGLYFTFEDWNQNTIENARSFLIKFPELDIEKYPKKHVDYIHRGEEMGINEGYKCSIRNRWYIIPSVYAPDAFFLRRNDIYPKFVINSMNAVSTDTMHRIIFKKNINPNQMILSYYNSITLAFTELNGRSHGGGVLELMPGEVESLIMPDLTKISNTKIDSLVIELDKTIRENMKIEHILNKIDQTVLVDYLDVDPYIVNSFRIMWRKLMLRRRSRKKNKKYIPINIYDDYYNRPEILSSIKASLENSIPKETSLNDYI